MAKAKSATKPAAKASKAEAENLSKKKQMSKKKVRQALNMCRGPVCVFSVRDGAGEQRARVAAGDRAPCPAFATAGHLCMPLIHLVLMYVSYLLLAGSGAQLLL